MNNDDMFFPLPTTPTIPPPTPARHMFPYGEYEFPPALFNFHHDHREWEAVAYLLEHELMYDKVVRAWGPGPHDEMPDFHLLLLECHASSEILMATLAKDLWRGEGTISKMFRILDGESIATVKEAMRIAGGF